MMLGNSVKNYLKSSPIFIFLPFLILFVLIILKLNVDSFQGDESRYYEFAKNILAGFYSPPAPNINLWNGPGYPLFIAPFVFLKMPLIAIKLANAFLQYFSIILLFLAIEKYTSRKYALTFSFLWATYYIAYQELPLILTEPLASFLSALVVFLVSRINGSNKPKKTYLILTGLAIGFLALTKIIFGYVILIMMLVYIFLLLIYRDKDHLINVAGVVIIAFLVTLPYLTYTYNLTGKILYWGNSGGSSLYWMSSPVEGEFGDWNNSTFTANCGQDFKIPCNSVLFAKNHQKDMDYISELSSIEKDDALKKIAISNIQNHPVKYIRNCLSNLSRLFFGIPNSYFYQREQTVFRLIPNSLIFTLLIFCSILTAVNFRTIKPEIHLIAGLTVTYLFLSTLVSAYPRQFYVVIPFIFFWASYVVCKTVTFKLKFCKDS